MLSTLMPPSISSRISRPAASIKRRMARTLSRLDGMNAWPPKPGFTGHHQNEIDRIDEGFQNGGGGAGIEHEARLRAALADQPERPVRVLAGLRMDRDEIRAGGEKVPDQPIYRFHHQVDIDGRVHPTPAQRFEHQRADAQVRHVMIVHDVEMDQVGARGNHVVDFLTEFGEVRRENGRRDPVVHGFVRRALKAAHSTASGAALA